MRDAMSHECPPHAEEMCYAYWDARDTDPEKAEQYVREMLESLFWDGEPVEALAWEWEMSAGFNPEIGDRVVRRYLRAAT